MTAAAAPAVLDPAGACALLGCGRTKLRELERQGLPVHRVSARIKRYLADELEAWVREQDARDWRRPERGALR